MNIGSRVRIRRAGVFVVAASLLCFGPTAIAHDDIIVVDDGVIDNAEATHHHHSHEEQHEGPGGHLPAGSENVELVGKGTVGNLGTGRIADVGVHNGYAYLTAFRDPRCQQGGVYIMDIQDPTNPHQVGFVPTSKDTYAGEGSQVISISTPYFNGDLLAFNNEICEAVAGGTRQANGGMTLVDVTNPTNPQKLVKHAGDVGADGRFHTIHSAFMWDAGDKAYAVTVDNHEFEDVDIFDISNPRKPVLIAEYDLAADFPQILQSGVGLDSVFHHDMIVKEIDGRQIMLVSYWDGGYVTLDVTNPLAATYVGDSDFAFPDSGATEYGLDVDPEGNAHQAEFSRDNEYIIAADEDFSPYKNRSSNVTDGTPFANTTGDATPALPAGEAFDFQTVFVGTACPGGLSPAVPAATGEGQIAVVERGICTFTEKIASVEAAGGYEAMLVFNREGADVGACADLLNMQVSGEIPAMFVARDVGFDLFDLSYDNAACRDATAQESGLAVGTLGDVVRFESYFDGWGYVHLYKNEPGKFTELDTYAVPEAFDEENAAEHGDLSVHEIAASHERDDLAYVSYYAAGLRIIKTVDDQIQEVGHFIDEGGNNFWGVQVFEHEGQEYVAASDRDFGIYIFKYTGSD
ncbi:PA domain-containing protein [Nocardioides sp. WS12]|uniref:PA domain-containing protein n=1 Tax=Nocardioides sp. WS12 TaxID=2486272 RepID=UPI0015FD6D88|nr:PA domain-containing protein [Nocardioides sp. WS12]